MRLTIPCILLLLLAAVPAAVAEPLDRSATSPAHAVWRAAPGGVLAPPATDAPPAPSGKTAERTPAPLLRAAGPSPDADDYDVIEPEHWRTITLSLDLSHGGHCDITLLRPLPWIASTGAAVGGTVALDMPEMGVSGAARVVAIGPCPPIGPPAPGARPITGTFVTTRAPVIDLSIEGLAQPVGTTASHPFWSLDRAGWVAAGDLQPGEKLRTVDGSAAVRSVTPRPGTETVYNLEVHRAHTYFVSDAKLLVHNACPVGRIGKARGYHSSMGDPADWKFVTHKSGSGTRGHETPQNRKIYEVWLDAWGTKREVHYFRRPDGSVYNVEIKPYSP